MDKNQKLIIVLTICNGAIIGSIFAGTPLTADDGATTITADDGATTVTADDAP